MGTGDAAMIASRVSSSAWPVERSITVSAPYLTANWSFSSSPSMSLVTAELPMFALILTFATLPTAIGTSEPARWCTLAGITRRPRATSLRTSSGLNRSRSATTRIASVTTPSRAARICVLLLVLMIISGLPTPVRTGSGSTGLSQPATDVSPAPRSWVEARRGALRSPCSRGARWNVSEADRSQQRLIPSVRQQRREDGRARRLGGEERILRLRRTLQMIHRLGQVAEAQLDPRDRDLLSRAVRHRLDAREGAVCRAGITRRRVRIAEQAERGGRRRVHLRGRLERSQRIGWAARVQPDAAQHESRHHLCRVVRDGALRGGQRLTGAVGKGERETERADHYRRSGVELRRALECRHRLGRTPPHGEELAQSLVRIGVRRVERDRAPEVALRLGPPPAATVEDTARRPGFGEPAVERDGTVRVAQPVGERTRGVDVCVERQQPLRGSEPAVRRRERTILGDGLLEVGDCLPERSRTTRS